jgi:catechol 2,3-dioxygenase-like lactoylglutathione lyase family enzyme
VARGGSVGRVAIQRWEHVGIVVDDLAAATAFFVGLGLTQKGESAIGGELVDRIVGLDGVRTKMAMLETPDGRGQFELIEFETPAAVGGDASAPANTPGLRHIAFAVDDMEATVARARALGAELVGEVVNYKGSYALCYLRGPGGIIVEFAEKLS